MQVLKITQALALLAVVSVSALPSLGNVAAAVQPMEGDGLEAGAVLGSPVDHDVDVVGAQGANILHARSGPMTEYPRPNEGYPNRTPEVVYRCGFCGAGKDTEKEMIAHQNVYHWRKGQYKYTKKLE